MAMAGSMTTIWAMKCYESVVPCVESCPILLRIPMQATRNVKLPRETKTNVNNRNPIEEGSDGCVESGDGKQAKNGSKNQKAKTTMSHLWMDGIIAYKQRIIDIKIGDGKCIIRPKMMMATQADDKAETTEKRKEQAKACPENDLVGRSTAANA